MVTSIDASDVAVKSPKSNSLHVIKFLCSYGGKILPRHPDGKLRYLGGETRVLAVDRSISFAELLLKLGELHGSSVCLRCQLPEEDLDALVSITSDEDLANVIEEYDLASQAAASPLKIRAFLWPRKPVKKASVSPPPPCAGYRTQVERFISHHPTPPKPASSSSPRVGYPVGFERSTRMKMCYYGGGGGGGSRGISRQSRLVHNGNHWQ